ncbi:hypothetical protein KIN20_027483 [Parelaphostrongylus tenuis]|uniref:Uncharacterized protein n=1 Tax=Parelaphostrongylus tenuis TaxID=148309 RepID=A0AAD5QZF7_PARTN|nr:hypothetical protein KIN20_027483 [Parelaphostrongylus tenuis]
MSSEGSSEISLNGNADDSGHEEDENENESEEVTKIFFNMPVACENRQQQVSTEGDAEYELDREEPSSPSSHEWKVILMKAEFADDLIEQIRKMKPYQRCERTGRIIATKSLQDLIQGFFLFLDCGAKIILKVMMNLTRDVFSSCDLLFAICSVLPDQLLKLQHDAVSTWFNVFHFLKFVPDPRSSIKPRIFSVFRRSQPKVLPVMIPYISENVLDKLDEPHKTADFFFRAFDKGDKFAILSLEAIFKLIVSHNFEYPNFYDHVFS